MQIERPTLRVHLLAPHLFAVGERERNQLPKALHTVLDLHCAVAARIL